MAPLSSELLEMWRKRARRAENSVGGLVGIGGPEGIEDVLAVVDPSATVRTSGDDGFLTFLARGFVDRGGGGVVE